MSARRFERVEEWGTRPVDGLDDVRALSDDGFTGAVEAGGTWAFLLNGRAVGVFGGDLEALGDASGTAYTAPHPSLPLLLAMQERGGETQARYYTNETPLSEVDETLSDANFTGYVELSENVLSGDYYLVYHGGNSMSVAFVGASDEVVTDDEAFDLAADEVGIYEVVRADVDVRDVPAPAGGGAGGSVAAGAGTGAGAGAAAGDADASDADGADAAPQTDDESVDGLESSADDAREPAMEDAVTEAEPTSEGGEADAVADDDADGTPDAGAGPADAGDASPSAVSGDGADAAGDEPTEPAASDETAAADEPSREESDAEQTPTTDERDRSDEPATAEAAEGDDSDPFTQEAEWRETTSIPAVDPDETATGDPPRDDGDAGAEEAGSGGGARQAGAAAASATDERSPSDGQQSSAERQPSDGPRTDDRTERAGGGEEAVELRQALSERTSELAEARERLEAVTDERDGLREERDRLRERVEELREEVSELRSELSAAQATGSEAAASGQAAESESLDPESALDGTDLFVRYASRGSATLDDVPDGADPDELGSNLRLDHHTQFDDEATTVEGRDYASFLEGTAEYGFVSWLVETLPFEVRDTAHEAELGDLYGALPDVDRADLRGTVDVETDEGTVSQTFDVVVRDRMGNPLVVADINDQRAPVSGEQMSDLVDSAVAVADDSDVAAAFYVTASFFEPDALEVADEETGGGFLSRDSRESFVKTSRKRGFHLCLVETRDGSFYLNVPEL
jgi:hypothetical protein